MSGEEDSSLREEIEEAFKNSNAKSDEVDNEGVVDKLEAKEKSSDEEGGKPRDEEGKFKKTEEKVDEIEKQEKKPAEKEADVVQPESTDAGVTLSTEKAPTSWSPAVREKWKDLPPEVRAEVIRREEASANGVRRLHEEYAPVRQFAEGLAPFIQEARSNGADPTQYIQSVLVSERGLRNPDPKQRFDVLLNIAEQYGIPLRDIINNSAGQEVIAARQAPAQLDPHIQAQLQQMQQFQQEFQQNAFKTEIDNFKKDKEFFEDVSSIMADLMDANRAKDLADAYEQACWLNPEVRKVLLERERSGKSTEDLKKRQAAAAKASVKTSGEADIKVNTDDEESIEDTVRRAIAEANGRV